MAEHREPVRLILGDDFASSAMLAAAHMRRLSMPVYRTPRNEVQAIAGDPAESWPFPREIEIDGSVFIEQPSFDSGWGITFHHVGSVHPRNSVGKFIHQYAEGRASGFPFWPTVAFSIRAAFGRLGPMRRES